MSVLPHERLAQLLTMPKIDGRCHVLDPQRHPYAPDVAYRPAGQEQGEWPSFQAVLASHHVTHALLVGPNSGYATDNRCLLDALALSQGAYQGIAVVANDGREETLRDLQQRGVIGIAFNPSLHGCDFYADIEPLLKRLAQLGMWAQFQVQDDQLLELLPMIERSGVRVMIDHCGRLNLKDSLLQSGFQTLLAWGRSSQTVVKLSGFAKFSENGLPLDDVRPVLEALAKNFGLQRCIWASDWPYLKAPYRLDYGPMLALYADFSASLNESKSCGILRNRC
ncbi:MAG: amidohydrolase family protein [Brachymonas sp.]